MPRQPLRIGGYRYEHTAPPTKESFDFDVGPEGALCVGSPETVARKIVGNLNVLDARRFDLKYGMPGMTHEQLMHTIELYGIKVIPRVRELIIAQQNRQPLQRDLAQ